jgi:hypothetical protein
MKNLKTKNHIGKEYNVIYNTGFVQRVSPPESYKSLSQAYQCLENIYQI